MAHKDPEKRRAWGHAYYLAHRAELCERQRERGRKYYGANRDKKLEYSRKYYEANREKRLKQQREYHEKHRDEAAENESRRVRISGMYMGMIGMTRKQREKFQKELNNGKTE